MPLKTAVTVHLHSEHAESSFQASAGITTGLEV